MIEPGSVATTPLTGPLAAARTLPVGRPLDEVLPVLQRGTTVACTGQAAVGLALALAGGASRAGSWVAVAGQPTLGLHAAQAAGVQLDRLVAVPGSGFSDRQWGETLAAMIDGFEVIVVGTMAGNVRAATGRRIRARALARGVVLITIGQHAAVGADVHLVSSAARWSGLGDGFGVALSRELDVEVRGRRVGRPRQISVRYPETTLPYVSAEPAPAPGVEPGPEVVRLDRSA